MTNDDSRGARDARPEPGRDWSIQEIAKLAGTTSRTLRHYDDIGLLAPSRTGSNGYRHYDGPALVRLQRILLLRELGLGLPVIAEVLAQNGQASEALRRHREWLRGEQERLARQIASVEHTIQMTNEGGPLMADKMFDGFEHTQYKDEVEQRWGADAYRSGDAWWRGMSEAERTDWKAAQAGLAADWADAASRGVDPESDEAQVLARRQFDWLASVPGTPGHGDGGPTKAYFTGLAEMYVDDERFAANYGGVEGATFVRDAMLAFAAREL